MDDPNFGLDPVPGLPKDRSPEDILTDWEAAIYILISKLGGWTAISPEEIAFYKERCRGATVVLKPQASGHRVLELSGPAVPKELSTMRRAVLVDMETFVAVRTDVGK